MVKLRLYVIPAVLLLAVLLTAVPRAAAALAGSPGLASLRRLASGPCAPGWQVEEVPRTGEEAMRGSLPVAGGALALFPQSLRRRRAERPRRL